MRTMLMPPLRFGVSLSSGRCVSSMSFLRPNDGHHHARGVDSTLVKNAPSSAWRACNGYRSVPYVQPSFSRKPKRHRFSVYWRLLIFDEYDAKSFNPQPTARKSLFCTHIVLSIATIRNRLDLSSIDVKSITAERVICHDCLDSITSTSSNSHRVRVPFH